MPKKKNKKRPRTQRIVDRTKKTNIASRLPAGMLEHDPTDFSDGGQCSRCGGCCASVLPVSDEEVAALREYAKEHGIAPKLPDGPNVAYLQCPFLEKRPDGRTDCLAYEARPAVCRVFQCHNTNRQNAQAWIDAHGEDGPPEPDNIWKVFNLTGLRLDGQDIPYDRAPVCRIETAEGVSYQFHVGRPASFILEDNTHIPFGVITGLFQNGIEMFNGDIRKLTFVPFENIRQVLSEKCVVPPLPIGLDVHDGKHDDDDDKTEEVSKCPETKA